MFSNNHPMIVVRHIAPFLPPTLNMSLDHGLTCGNAASSEPLSASVCRS
jgi:hypothetical protein